MQRFAYRCTESLFGSFLRAIQCIQYDWDVVFDVSESEYSKVAQNWFQLCELSCFCQLLCVCATRLRTYGSKDVSRLIRMILNVLEGDFVGITLNDVESDL